MARPRDKLAALQEAAEERGLTPLSWWIGTRHHDDVRDALEHADDLAVETEGDRVTQIEGLPVKLLTESPERFALWCEEGALDL